MRPWDCLGMSDGWLPTHARRRGARIRGVRLVLQQGTWSHRPPSVLRGHPSRAAHRKHVSGLVRPNLLSQRWRLGLLAAHYARSADCRQSRRPESQHGSPCGNVGENRQNRHGRCGQLDSLHATVAETSGGAPGVVAPSPITLSARILGRLRRHSWGSPEAAGISCPASGGVVTWRTSIARRREARAASL